MSTKNTQDTASKTSQGTIASKTAYESTVITRAVERAGANPHLKGHIHEVMVADLKNLGNLLNGRHTQLTQSTTASTVDLVTLHGGKVVERLQLKDTLSTPAINKLVRQVASGKYRSVQLVGTEETTKLVNAAFEKAGIAKRMASSGISSGTTTRLAQQAGATGSGTLGGAVLQSAKTSGVLGGGIAAGFAAVSGVVDLINGEREVGEVVASTTKAGAKGYLSGAAASAAVTATAPAVTGALVSAAATAGGAGAAAAMAGAAAFGAPLVIAAGVGWGVCKLFDSIFD